MAKSNETTDRENTPGALKKNTNDLSIERAAIGFRVLYTFSNWNILRLSVHAIFAARAFVFKPIRALRQRRVFQYSVVMATLLSVECQRWI